jgi:hypothetical protein
MNTLLNGLLVLAALSFPALVYAEVRASSVPSQESRPTRPKPTDAWPSSVASLRGGLYTTSEQQRFNAVKWGLPYTDSESDFLNLVSSGIFVRLENTATLKVLAKHPFVRSETAQFVYTMAQTYNTVANCGTLFVTGAGRLPKEVYDDSSLYTVHPYGMAIDVRLKFIEQRCADWIRSYVLEKEQLQLIDATEHGDARLHMHIVVVPKQTRLGAEMVVPPQ